MTISKRGQDWLEFSQKVLDHIENYTVPQYGDKGDDLASEYDAKTCNDQIKKYASRFGKNSREGQEQLDFMKIAHYSQMGHSSLNLVPTQRLDCKHVKGARAFGDYYYCSKCGSPAQIHISKFE